jgi:hypothetical protein
MLHRKVEFSAGIEEIINAFNQNNTENLRPRNNEGRSPSE